MHVVLMCNSTGIDLLDIFLQEVGYCNVRIRHKNDGKFVNRFQRRLDVSSSAEMDNYRTCRVIV